MSETWLENPLLTPIFDQIATLVEYTHVSIYVRDGNDLALLAYRGPVPSAVASLFNFPLARAGGARRVIGERAPLLIADAKADTPIARSFWEATKEVPDDTFDYIGSWIGLPLWIGGQVTGMLDLAHRERGYYTMQHVSLLQDYVGQVAAHIENAILYTHLEQRSAELQTLYALQQAIGSHLDIRVVLQLVADQARRLTSARQVLVFLREGETLRAAFGAGETSPRLEVGCQLPIFGSLIGQVLQTAQPLRIFDTLNDPRLDPEECHRLGIRSLLAVPLMAPSGPIGALLATNKVFGAFGPNDERVLALLASGAAVGLESARLYREEQNRRRIAEGMQQILTHLSADESLDEILNAVIGCAIDLMEAKAGAIFRSFPVSGPASLLAARGLDARLLELLCDPLIGQARLRTTSLSGQKQDGSEAALNGLWGTSTSEKAAVLDLREGRQAPTSFDLAIDRLARCFPTILSIPLTIKGDVIGLLEFYYDHPYFIPPDQRQLAQTIGQHVALALERKRLASKAEELVRLQERQRIAQALHDSVAQFLFRIGLEAEWCLKNVALDSETSRRLQAVRRLVARGSYELRSAIFALRQRPLTGEHSLVDLLEDQITEFQSESGIQARLVVSSGLVPVPAPVAEAIFRIVREALTNVQKHAKASAVLVSLHSEEGAVTVIIQDNGTGMEPASLLDVGETELHFGLSTMRRLATQLGGQLFVSNNDDHGLLVKARIPVMVQAGV